MRIINSLFNYFELYYFLLNIYDNLREDFIINDIEHKIILLLLNLKFDQENKNDNNKDNNNSLESVISKILWIESNSIIIKEILDIYKLSSENIIYESIGNTFINEIKSIILKKSVKYEPNEKHLKLVNESFYVILVILIKCYQKIQLIVRPKRIIIIILIDLNICLNN